MNIWTQKLTQQSPNHWSSHEQRLYEGGKCFESIGFTRYLTSIIDQMNQDLDPWPHCVTHTFQFGKFEIIHNKRIQEKKLYTKIHQT